jgi:glycosyltransferase involved in cell wall biosynthesis
MGGVTGARRLLVEGWRFLPHSYALVAQSHCLYLARRGDVELRFADLPFYDPGWKPARGIFASADEALLASLRAPEASFSPQATFTLRPERPDFSAPTTGERFAFATAEYRVLTLANVGALRSATDVPSCVHVVTPSRWAAGAYQRFGFADGRIHVVPHGVDPAIFRPDEAARLVMRRALGVERNFLFACAGAMTWNKGLDVLLGAFARLVDSEPDVRLLLKGADALYPSLELVREVLGDLPSRARSAVSARLIYEGRTFSAKVMADLLRAADCYVSPYRAEGFNLPVLEAMACGVGVICTAGGPTDEFTEQSFALRIPSRIATKRLDPDHEGEMLEPDMERLSELMGQAARDPAAARARGALAARYARERFSWEAMTGVLLGALFPA